MRRRKWGAFAVAAAAVLVDYLLGGHYGAFACGIAFGGFNVAWWSR